MQTNEDFKAVKYRIDIVSEIRSRTGQPTKSIGSDCIDLKECPFCKGHDCFRITPSKGVYYCHECPGGGKGGDIFNFVANLDNCSRLEALEDLAASCGYEMAPATKGTNKEDPRQKERETLQDVRNATAEYYHKNMFKDQNALRYQTQDRKHSHDVLKAFQVGYSDGRLHEHLAGHGFPQELRLKSGLTNIHEGRERDYFTKGLYIYPHRGRSGQIEHFTQKDPRGKMKYQLPNDFKDPECHFYNMPALKSNGPLILVEGENDLLTVVDRGEFQNVIAGIGRLSKTQLDYLAKWAPGKTLFVCSDNDKGGENYREDVRKAFQALCMPPRLAKISNEPVTTLKFMRFDPEHNDIDDYLRSRKDAKRALIKCLDQAEQILMPLKSVMHAYRTLCDDQERKRNGDEIGEIVFDCLNILGHFFVVGEEDCRLSFQGKIYRIGNVQAFKSILYEKFGLNYALNQTKQAVEVIKSKGYSFGEHTTEPGSIHGDLEKSAIYFNLHNERNEIIRISPGKVEVFQNGTNPYGVFLGASPKVHPVEYDQAADIMAAMRILVTLIYDNLTCDVQGRFFLLCSIFNTLLLPFIKAKGISKLSGDSGSAKTGAASIITSLVYGEDYVTIGSTAFDFAEATRSPITVMDNLENADITADKKRFLLTAGSGVTNQKRKGGTDSENVYERAQTIVIVTAIEPFMDSELIQRTNDIEFDKRYRNPDYPEAKALEAEIVKNRGLIFSAFFKILAHDVLPEFLQKRERALQMLRDEYPGHAKERLNELYACLFILCGELVKYIPHPEYNDSGMTSGQIAKAILDDWINYQNARSKTVTSGTDPVLDRLEILLRLYQKNKTAFEQEYDIHRVDESENGEEIQFVCSSSELLFSFNLLTKNRGLPRVFTSPGQLGKRISNSRQVLEENGWLFFPREENTGTEKRHRFVKMLSSDN
ncbi:putative DNA primase [delta proteobacterium NaphS2]|nr:putative DNA primase [delta proteobacterium NaphS2]